jgi:hypothetical protein
VIDLKFQLCRAINFAHSTCTQPHQSNSTNGTSSAVTTSNATSSSSGHNRRELGGSGAPATGATTSDLTYYVSVKCSSAAPASFKLLATAINSHLPNGVSVHGELCPGVLIHHHWEYAHSRSNDTPCAAQPKATLHPHARRPHRAKYHLASACASLRAGTIMWASTARCASASPSTAATER